MSELFKLRSHDFVKGIITAIFAAVITTLYGVVSQAGFDVFNADWASIFNEVIKVSCSTFIAYIGKNFLTDAEGNIAGIKTN